MKLRKQYAGTLRNGKASASDISDEMLQNVTCVLLTPLQKNI